MMSQLQPTSSPPDTPDTQDSHMTDATADRQKAMAILAAASEEALSEAVASFESHARHAMVRAPEVGLVMARGRMGGSGSPFNLGEVTVTRCVVRLESGEIGSSYSLGRDKKKAHHAAILDALWQNNALRTRIETEVLAPLAASQEAKRATTRTETAATKVDFFTMVRGED